MTIMDRATRKVYHMPDGDVLFPMGRRADWRMRCELWVFLVRSESRVFVAGGEFGFDGLAREADDVEIEALADRFNLNELRLMLAARATSARSAGGTTDQTPRPIAVADKRSWLQRLFRHDARH